MGASRMSSSGRHVRVREYDKVLAHLVFHDRADGQPTDAPYRSADLVGSSTRHHAWPRFSTDRPNAPKSTPHRSAMPRFRPWSPIKRNRLPCQLMLVLKPVRTIRMRLYLLQIQVTSALQHSTERSPAAVATSPATERMPPLPTSAWLCPRRPWLRARTAILKAGASQFTISRNRSHRAAARSTHVGPGR